MNQRTIVLITGGLGMVANRLAFWLKQQGYEVWGLSRSPQKKSENFDKMLGWDIEKNFIDPSFRLAHHIVHLAGAGIMDKYWTASRKREIMDSRVNSTKLLLAELSKDKGEVVGFIQASAIGIYPSSLDSKWETPVPCNQITEQSKNFAQSVCLNWERAAMPIKDLGIRFNVVRIGIVLSTRGGALPEMLKSFNVNVGTYFGKGNQWISWVHIDDLCRQFIHLIAHNELSGLHHGSGAAPCTGEALQHAIAKAMNKRALITSMPEFVLKLVLGERAEVALQSSFAPCNTLPDFKFKFESAELAVKDLLTAKT